MYWIQYYIQMWEIMKTIFIIISIQTMLLLVKHPWFSQKKKKSEMINTKLFAMMVVRVEYVDIYISLLAMRYLFHNKVIIS